MSALRWLSPADGPDSLPDPRDALVEPNGLLAAGGSLEPEWLLASYARGIFPWYENGQPILWWSPDPRMVLVPQELVVSRSLGKTLRNAKFELTADTAFSDVIEACAAPRRYTDETWITREMAAAYTRLHELGLAHSFETWLDGDLVGGLYGVAIGGVFFGESMFARSTDASKVALAHAARYFSRCGIELIDCQLPSGHLYRLGARNVSRDEFLSALRILTRTPAEPGSWTDRFRDADIRAQFRP
jgi:leucyl/phenylalanyl-tRNA--protein transferase